MIIALIISGLVCQILQLCLIFIGMLLRQAPVILVSLPFGFLSLLFMMISVLLVRKDVEGLPERSLWERGREVVTPHREAPRNRAGR
ncbi:TPA_asm: ORFX protein [Trifolium occidentale waikavirus]|uniref:ORFX protein n=1 Tax=Trifolium occidentale waikavirus TaxID=3027353 RepID=A0AA48P959_9SECO|nr:TPA_asm: ORFX protein [Trifolium occidentale waikavirus]